MMYIKRYEENPIVVPGEYEWRQAVVFNPAVIHDGDHFYMYERASEHLRPYFDNSIGVLKSEDGINFSPVRDEPILTAEELGFPKGSIQDPWVVEIDGRYYMTFALRPCAVACYPSGRGPRYERPNYDGKWGKPEHFRTRSGIAVSDDLINFDLVGYTTPPDVDDRDNVLFPEKVDGKYVLFRRPMSYVGKDYGTQSPALWISYSDDLTSWTEPELLIKPEQKWEQKKIGAAAPPLKTEKGWLTLYHGVDNEDVYRVGALLLDLEDPKKVLARTEDYIMEPKEYYEKFGLVIPNVIFPTGNVLKDGTIYIYYGCCDTSIGLVSVELEDILSCLLK